MTNKEVETAIKQVWKLWFNGVSPDLVNYSDEGFLSKEDVVDVVMDMQDAFEFDSLLAMYDNESPVVIYWRQMEKDEKQKLAERIFEPIYAEWYGRYED